MVVWIFFFFKQKTAYEMRISDWSSDVCSSDLMSSRASAIAESAGNQTSATNVINDAAARAAAGSQQVSHTADQVAKDAQQANVLAEDIRAVVTRLRSKSVALRSTS